MHRCHYDYAKIRLTEQAPPPLPTNHSSKVRFLPPLALVIAGRQAWLSDSALAVATNDARSRASELDPLGLSRPIRIRNRPPRPGAGLLPGEAEGGSGINMMIR
jgi:hypothetical protein